MDADGLNDLADRLFGAFVDHDLDVAESMMAPNAAVVQNGNSMSWAEARRMIEGIATVIGDHRYEEVRRIVGDQAIVEEHQVRSTTPSGHDVDLAACVVIRLDGDGKVVSLDEYVDTAPLVSLQA